MLNITQLFTIDLNRRKNMIHHARLVHRIKTNTHRNSPHWTRIAAWSVRGMDQMIHGRSVPLFHRPAAKYGRFAPLLHRQAAMVAFLTQMLGKSEKWLGPTNVIDKKIDPGSFLVLFRRTKTRAMRKKCTNVEESEREWGFCTRKIRVIRRMKIRKWWWWHSLNSA